MLEALLYIAKDSYLQSINVSQQIEATILALLDHPTKYPPDKWKTNNDGSYRAFEVYRLRISYRIFKNSIHIIRVRHTSRRPAKH